jgi:subtilisin-like proprotein convertase family protein
MLEGNPALNPTEVRNALVASSIDMLAAGFDFTTGSGLIQAYEAICESGGDNVSPDAVCQDIVVELDEDGFASIVASDIDGGSTDNCGGPLTFELNVSGGFTGGFYDCDDLGGNPEQLIVTDGNGNKSSCEATVTVVDVTPPTAICRSITRYLAFGTCDLSVDPLEINAGSFDNCTIIDYALDQDYFDDGDVGDNLVTLTVTDQSGNSSSCEATVTVLRRPTEIENLGVFEGQYSDYPEISARLTDVLTGLPLEGKEVEFELSEGTAGTELELDFPAGAIPDNDPAGFCDAITVSGAGGAITNVAVIVDITHTWVGDLDITLISPEGTPIRLLDRPGLPPEFSCCGCSDDNVDALVFYDDSQNGVDFVENYCFANPANWNAGLPTAQPIDALSTLRGESANGDWTLCVTDNFGLDIGSLDFWAIEIEWASTARVERTSFSKDLKLERKQPIDYEAYASASEEEKRAANERRAVDVDEALPPANATTIYLTATTDANGIATINPRLGYPQPPTILGYEYIITSIFPDDDPCYGPSRDDDVFTVLQEDARVTYTGKNFASTISGQSSDAVVFLAATVCDISSTPDASGDSDPGDISNATVTFVDRDNGNTPISPPLHVVPLPGDTTKGTVSYVWMTNIGFAVCKTYNIGIVVNNYYTRDDAADDQVIEVCRPGNEFVTDDAVEFFRLSAGRPGHALQLRFQCQLPGP